LLIKAVVTSILPVKDMARPRGIYEKKLGLEPKWLAADGTISSLAAATPMFALITKPELTKAAHASLSFEVQGIERVISELQAERLLFDDYGFPNPKTVDHVRLVGSEKAAWFKDCEGNCLCLHEGPH
jgi:hypothetical protein